jgi:hypothetical protein
MAGHTTCGAARHLVKLTERNVQGFQHLYEVILGHYKRKIAGLESNSPKKYQPVERVEARTPMVVEGVASVVVEGVAHVAPPRDQGFLSTEARRQTADCGPTVTLPSSSSGPRAFVASAPRIACVSLLPTSPTRPSLLQVGPTKFDPEIRIQSNQMYISMDNGDNR